MARRLKAYGITPTNRRDPVFSGSKVRKAYFRKDFADAWARYLPPEDPKDAVRPPPQSAATTATGTTSAESGNGQAPTHHCGECGREMYAEVSINRGKCEKCHRKTKEPST